MSTSRLCIPISTRNTNTTDSTGSARKEWLWRLIIFLLLAASAHGLSIPTSPSFTPAAMKTDADNVVAVNIQEISNENSFLLWEFLRIAAHEDDLSAVKSNPALARYAADFCPSAGKDFGWIAYLMDDDLPVVDHDDHDSTKCPVGAVWVRHWDDPTNRGFAFVSDNIPELAFGVRPEYQGKGIGTALLKKLLEQASRQIVIEGDDDDEEEGHEERRVLVPGISLSVRDSNPALRLYQRSGFTCLEAIPNRVGGHSFTMVKLFDPEAVVVRSVITEDDIPSILSLLHKKKEETELKRSSTLADSTRRTPLTVTEEKLTIALLQEHYAHVILAERAVGGPFGMALYYYRFSSSSGERYIWLEDLYVDHDHHHHDDDDDEQCRRGQDVEMMLLHRIADIARAQHNSSSSNSNSSTPLHVEWVASTRDTKALLLYQKLGAQIVQQDGDTCTFKWLIDGTSTTIV